MGVVVEEATAVDDELVEGLAGLIPQLSSSAALPGADELRRIVESPATVLLVAREGRRILGSLTLVLFRIPTGMRAIIEDVVTDAGSRGKGVASALTRVALDRAAGAGCRNVDLTSRPSREVANRLYQRLGFTRRETNVYRYELDEPR